MGGGDKLMELSLTSGHSRNADMRNVNVQCKVVMVVDGYSMRSKLSRREKMERIGVEEFKALSFGCYCLSMACRDVTSS